MDNFGEQMHLMGQIEALLKAEMSLIVERKQLEAQLSKLKEQENELQQSS
jgi:ketol-acid reductoisomerase